MALIPAFEARALDPEVLLPNQKDNARLWAMYESDLPIVGLEFMGNNLLVPAQEDLASVKEKLKNWAASLLTRVHKLFSRVGEVAKAIPDSFKKPTSGLPNTAMSLPDAKDASKVSAYLTAGVAVVTSIGVWIAAKKYGSLEGVRNILATLRGKVGPLEKVVPKDLAVWRQTIDPSGKVSNSIVRVAAKEAYGEGEYKESDWNLDGLKVSNITPEKAGYNGSIVESIQQKLSSVKTSLLGLVHKLTGSNSGSDGIVAETISKQDSSFSHIAATVWRIMGLCAWVLYHIVFKALKLLLALVRKLVGNPTPVE